MPWKRPNAGRWHETMAVREIILYPEREIALRRRSEPVQVFNRSVRRLMADLAETLLACPEGVGLAAPQVNDHRRVIVVRLGSAGGDGGEASPPIAVVNPIVLEAREERMDFDGCLSFPGLFGQTARPHYLHVSALDEDGALLDRVFEGFDAVVVHHEIDHLEGVLFIDRIERVEDLYRVRVDEDGRRVHVPVSAGCYGLEDQP
jgi:peptide deformylase